MKPLALTVVIVLSILNAYPQSNANESFYLFDQDFNGVQDQSKAKFFGRMLKISDTCYQWDLYNFAGPRVARIQYKDELQTIPHGKLLYYNKKGYFDSTGYAHNSKRDGDWYYYNDTGKAVVLKKYSFGKLLSTDTLQDKNKEDEEDDENNHESSFPGGLKKWRKYLVDNMQYPERALAIESDGIVYVQFIIDKEGGILDVEVCKSVEFSMDEEATRLIKNSPKWTPAVQDGRLVKSYKKQPFIFKTVKQ